MIYSANDIIEYVNCPSRYFLNVTSKVVPDRYTLKKRLYDKTPDFVNLLVNPGENNESEYRILSMAITDGLSSINSAKDSIMIRKMMYAIEMFLARRELKVYQAGEDVEVNYGQHTLSTRYDAVVEEVKSGRKFPVMFDFSNTKYEAQFNPISYRCQVVADHFNLKDKNTVVKVVTISNESVWDYDHRKYKDVLGLSIEETIRAIELNMYPMRLGWWCAGCHWRGLCHRFLEIK